MGVMAAAALWRGRSRAHAAVLAGLGIACVSPLLSSLDWSGVPGWIRNYLAPSRASFALFPWGAYLAFGVAAGAVLRGIPADRLERTLQWGVLLGFALVSGGQYFSSLPYSLYPGADFWTDSPALVLIRVGVTLLALAGAYLWTEYGSRARWSWVQAMGKTSLLVYWVHVILVYGLMADRWKRSFSLWQAAAATVAVTGLMLLLAVARLRWAARRPRPVRAPLAAEAAAS